MTSNCDVSLRDARLDKNAGTGLSVRNRASRGSARAIEGCIGRDEFQSAPVWVNSRLSQVKLERLLPSAAVVDGPSFNLAADRKRPPNIH